MIIKHFKNFHRYRWLLTELVIRDLKIRYRRSVLGYLWSLLNPLLMMLVISTIFSYAFRFQIDNFPIYLLSGTILFNFFSEATNNAMSSILYNGGLIKKVYIPKYIFPLAKVLSAFVNLFFSLLAIVIMLFVTHTEIKATVLLFSLPLLYILLFSIGIGLILSVLVVYFRDVMHLYGILLTAWMYFTPIFYPAEILPDSAKWVLNVNPIYHFVKFFRQIILEGSIPSFADNAICLGFGIGALICGLAVFKSNQKNFILYI